MYQSETHPVPYYKIDICILNIKMFSGWMSIGYQRLLREEDSKSPLHGMVKIQAQGAP
jgi:hypothetical protein